LKIDELDHTACIDRWLYTLRIGIRYDAGFDFGFEFYLHLSVLPFASAGKGTCKWLRLERHCGYPLL
jgi:hypothetical protein